MEDIFGIAPSHSCGGAENGAISLSLRVAHLHKGLLRSAEEGMKRSRLFLHAPILLLVPPQTLRLDARLFEFLSDEIQRTK